MERLGLLDDYLFACAWIRERTRVSPKGRRAIENELRRKGLANEDIARAFNDVHGTQHDSEQARCAVAAEKWLRRKTVPASSADAVRFYRRLQQFLLRRGYSFPDVQQTMKDTRANVH
jgi:regulatory protein